MKNADHGFLKTLKVIPPINTPKSIIFVIFAWKTT